MKITIKRTEDQLALVRAMASSNREESYEAQAAVASLIGPVVNEVINNATTIGNLFSTMTYEWDDNPSLPLDLFHDITDEDYIQIYSQQVAGGLPYNQVFPAHNELKFNTYTIDSALAFDRKYARKARVDVVSKTFTRMAQEVMLKQERTAFNVLASALIKGNGTTNKRIISSNNQGRIILDDLNRLITKSKRINSSWAGGTPVGGANVGVTDLMVSPEMVEKLRSMSYNPINTEGGARTAGSSNTSTESAVSAPESLRETLYSGAGLPNFYGINIIEVLEMGIEQRFNKIALAIDAGDASTVTSGGQGSSPDAGFSSTDELLIGIDRSKESLIRPVVLDEGASDAFNVQVDDQFSVRQEKIGWFGKIEEGRLCIDDKALVGIVA
jgi:hypothetical protein